MLSPDKFRQFYHHAQPRLYRFIFKQVHSQQEAEDLCQESFLRLHEHLQHKTSSIQWEPWLFGIARRLLNNRHKKVNRWFLALKSLFQETKAPPNTPEQSLENAQTREAIHAQLQRLSELDRSLLVLFSEGYTNQEIAVLLKLTPAAARKRLQRAKYTIKKMLPPRL